MGGESHGSYHFFSMPADTFFSIQVFLKCRCLLFAVEGNVLGRGCSKVYQNGVVTRLAFNSKSAVSSTGETEQSEPKFCALLGKWFMKGGKWEGRWNFLRSF